MGIASALDASPVAQITSDEGCFVET